MSSALVPAEKARLAELEAQAETGFESVRTGFAKAGEALEKIRDERLYRATHDTFEAYCEERWGFKSSRARQLIAGWRTVTARNALGLPVPSTEWEARQMAREMRRDAHLKEAAFNLARAEECREAALAQIAKGRGLIALARMEPHTPDLEAELERLERMAGDIEETANRPPWVDLEEVV